MSTRLNILVGLVFASSAAVAYPQSLPSLPPASRPASNPAAMAAFTKAIGEANTLAAAAHAYASGCSIDREDRELNTAYMRRTLQLGQVQVANIPAVILVRQDGNEAMAQAVVGCCCGRRGEYSPAFFHTMMAAALDGNDPSVLNNLGQLVAWHEGAQAVTMVPELQALEKALKDKLSGKPAYQAGYQAVKAAYDERNVSVARDRQEAAAINSEIRALAEKIAVAENKLRPFNDDIAPHQARIDDLRGITPTKAQAGAVADAIRREQIAIDEIQKKAEPFRKDIQDAQRDIAARQAAQKAVLGRTPEVQIKKYFRWLPPAVNGVVVVPPDTPPAPRPASAPVSAPLPAGTR